MSVGIVNITAPLGEIDYLTTQNLAASGITTQTLVISGTGLLQGSLILTEDSLDAVVGTDGITIISGSNATTVSGFYGEFVAASGLLQTQIDSLDNTYATDAHLVNVSGHLQTQIDTNTSTIANLDSTYATDAQLISVSGHLQTQITTNSDHGNLGGLGDDDHTQYIRVDGARAFTGSQSLGGNNLTNVNRVGAPTNQQVAVSGSQVRVVATGTNGLQIRGDNSAPIGIGTDGAITLQAGGGGATLVFNTDGSTLFEGNTSLSFEAPTVGFSSLTPGDAINLTTNALSSHINLETQGLLSDIFLDAFNTVTLQYQGSNRLIAQSTDTRATTVPFRIIQGTEALPALTRLNDTNTGLWFINPDVIGLSAGGTNRLTISGAGGATNGVGVAGNATITGAVGASAGRFGSTLNIPRYTTNPSSPQDGDVWINLTTSGLRWRVNGVTNEAPHNPV